MVILDLVGHRQPRTEDPVQPDGTAHLCDGEDQMICEILGNTVRFYECLYDQTLE